MNVEMTLLEAELLIACLTFTEGIAQQESPAITEALSHLREWRSALLRAYLRERSVAPASTPSLIDVDGGALGDAHEESEPSKP